MGQVIVGTMPMKRTAKSHERNTPDSVGSLMAIRTEMMMMNNNTA
jgi:hypothetical protein